MSCSVSILRRAQKELGQVSSPTFERVCDAIRALGSNPRPPGCRKLVNREGWRIWQRMQLFRPTGGPSISAACSADRSRAQGIWSRVSTRLLVLLAGGDVKSRAEYGQRMLGKRKRLPSPIVPKRWLLGGTSLASECQRDTHPGRSLERAHLRAHGHRPDIRC